MMNSIYRYPEPDPDPNPNPDDELYLQVLLMTASPFRSPTLTTSPSHSTGLACDVIDGLTTDTTKATFNCPAIPVATLSWIIQP